jgi:hypothetical protein
VSTQPEYQRVIPGTYNGRVNIDGQPAPDGTPISAAIDGVIWAVTATRGGRYVMDVPQRLPVKPPWFPEAGTIMFLTDWLPARESVPWRPGLAELDLTFDIGRGRVAPVGRRKFSADYLQRARNLYSDAAQRFQEGRYAEVVSAAQEALELAVKAVFIETGVDFPRSHRIGEPKFEDKLRALRDAEHWKKTGGWEAASLARLIFYSDFWGQGYTAAKYGSDALDASPSELFGRPEAELALSHLAEAVGRLQQLFPLG